MAHTLTKLILDVETSVHKEQEALCRSLYRFCQDELSVKIDHILEDQLPQNIDIDFKSFELDLGAMSEGELETTFLERFEVKFREELNRHNFSEGKSFKRSEIIDCELKSYLLYGILDSNKKLDSVKAGLSKKLSFTESNLSLELKGGLLKSPAALIRFIQLFSDSEINSFLKQDDLPDLKQKELLLDLSSYLSFLTKESLRLMVWQSYFTLYRKAELSKESLHKVITLSVFNLIKPADFCESINSLLKLIDTQKLSKEAFVFAFKKTKTKTTKAVSGKLKKRLRALGLTDEVMRLSESSDSENKSFVISSEQQIKKKNDEESAAKLLEDKISAARNLASQDLQGTTQDVASRGCTELEDDMRKELDLSTQDPFNRSDSSLSTDKTTQKLDFSSHDLSHFQPEESFELHDFIDLENKSINRKHIESNNVNQPLVEFSKNQDQLREEIDVNLHVESSLNDQEIHHSNGNSISDNDDLLERIHKAREELSKELSKTQDMDFEELVLKPELASQKLSKRIDQTIYDLQKELINSYPEFKNANKKMTFTDLKELLLENGFGGEYKNKELVVSESTYEEFERFVYDELANVKQLFDQADSSTEFSAKLKKEYESETDKLFKYVRSFSVINHDETQMITNKLLSLQRHLQKYIVSKSKIGDNEQYDTLLESIDLNHDDIHSPILEIFTSNKEHELTLGAKKFTKVFNEFCESLEIHINQTVESSSVVIPKLSKRHKRFEEALMLDKSFDESWETWKTDVLALFMKLSVNKIAETFKKESSRLLGLRQSTTEMHYDWFGVKTDSARNTSTPIEDPLEYNGEKESVEYFEESITQFTMQLLGEFQNNLETYVDLDIRKFCSDLLIYSKEVLEDANSLALKGNFDSRIQLTHFKKELLTLTESYEKELCFSQVIKEELHDFEKSFISRNAHIYKTSITDRFKKSHQELNLNYEFKDAAVNAQLDELTELLNPVKNGMEERQSPRTNHKGSLRDIAIGLLHKFLPVDHQIFKEMSSGNQESFNFLKRSYLNLEKHFIADVKSVLTEANLVLLNSESTLPDNSEPLDELKKCLEKAIHTFYKSIESEKMKSTISFETEELTLEAIKSYFTVSAKQIAIPVISDKKISDTPTSSLASSYIDVSKEFDEDEALNIQGITERDSSETKLENSKNEKYSTDDPDLKAIRPYAPVSLPKVDIRNLLVTNAGLVLLMPYFGHLFQNLDLRNKDEFLSLDDQFKAVLLTHYAATGKSTAEEHQLSLNKVLCGLEITQPLPTEQSLSEEECREVDEMIKAALSHWPAMKGTSVEGFRQSFLQREGLLTEKDQCWLVEIEHQTIDILLDSIPWSFRFMNFSWFQKVVEVSW
ncbi:MAG: contractile injection system tape measure protein [Lentisphaeraceae bacterium]|nr:contractile injection system tape measure protein [Lentisphaeraceae bacterium]